jgi:prepilin-type processing-associated H-X9-DG protein
LVAICAVVLFAIAVILCYRLAPRQEGSMIFVQSARNLRQIGVAIKEYCDHNSGLYPDSFRTLFADSDDITSEIFVDTRTGETRAEGPTREAIADQLALAGHDSYVYVGQGLATSSTTSRTVIAYERHPPPGWSSVLFGDGHVDTIDEASRAKILAETQAGMTPITLPAN